MFGQMSVSNLSSNLADFSGILPLIVSLVLASHILLKKHEPVVCLSWLLGVATFPIPTAICYLGFGINPFEKYAARKRASKHLAGLRRIRLSREEITSRNRQLLLENGFTGFDRTALWASMLQGASMQSGNKADVLVNSTTAFAALREAIEGAQQFILVQFYQIQIDSVGTQFLDLLAEKAKHGVKVYVLFDALGSHRLKTSIMEDYRRRGLKINRFLEVHPIKRRFQINWRNHRKLVVVDGRVAFTGGFNIGQMYLEGPDPTRPRWFDLIFRVHGPVIADLTAIFAEDWHFTTGRTIPTDIIETAQVTSSPTAHSNNLLHVIASGPSENNAPFYSTFINILHEARSRVWVMTPYFVPDKGLLNAMRMAVVRGVDVRVIVPKHSNHPITDSCAHSYFAELHRYGVDLQRYVPGVCHGKLLLADDDLILAGSSNLDYRSFFLNFETDLLMRDRDLAQRVACIFDEVSPHCIPLGSAEVSGKHFGRLLFQRVMRLFAPLM
jgi:cardiolipin synthase